MSSGISVELAEWSRLYAIASQVKQLAPWQWMAETDIFGIEKPNGELVFVSVMGALGEHFAVAAYPGIEALSRFWNLQNNAADVDPTTVLEIPQLQLAFDDRKFLDAPDLAILKQLGLKFRGKNAWPNFCSYRPGFVPGPLQPDEAATMRVVLEQLVEVAPALRDNPQRVRPDDPDNYLVRIGRGNGEWQDEFRRLPLITFPPVRVLPNTDEVRRGHALPKVESRIDIDFLCLPTPIQTGKERPFYPYMLLMVDSQRGAIVGQEMLSVESDVDEMLRRLPNIILRQLEKLGIRPTAIGVRTGRLEHLLRPWCESLGIQLLLPKNLRMLDEARHSLLEFLTHTT